MSICPFSLTDASPNDGFRYDGFVAWFSMAFGGYKSLDCILVNTTGPWELRG